MFKIENTMYMDDEVKNNDDGKMVFTAYGNTNGTLTKICSPQDRMQVPGRIINLRTLEICNLSTQVFRQLESKH